MGKGYEELEKKIEEGKKRREERKVTGEAPPRKLPVNTKTGFTVKTSVELHDGLNSYLIGSKVPMEDGIHAYEKGYFVISGGIFINAFDKILGVKGEILTQSIKTEEITLPEKKKPGRPKKKNKKSPVNCPECDGDGINANGQKCQECKGEGKIESEVKKAPLFPRRGKKV